VQQVSDSDLGDIFAAAAAILRPHDVSGLQVAVTSLTYVSDTQGKVLWSASRLAPSPHKAGDIVTVPSGILVAGTSVIMSEVVYTYKDPMGVINLAGLGGTYNVSDTYFDRPRRTLAVGKV
jgi:hypothetical protein